MSRNNNVFVDLEDAFIDEVKNRVRESEVWQVLDDSLAGNRGDYNTQTMDAFAKGIQTMYNFFYDVETNWDERKVFDETLALSLDFAWMTTIEKDRGGNGYPPLKDSITDQEYEEFKRIGQDYDAYVRDLRAYTNRGRGNYGMNYGGVRDTPRNFRDNRDNRYPTQFGSGYRGTAVRGGRVPTQSGSSFSRVNGVQQQPLVEPVPRNTNQVKGTSSSTNTFAQANRERRTTFEAEPNRTMQYSRFGHSRPVEPNRHPRPSTEDNKEDVIYFKTIREAKQYPLHPSKPHVLLVDLYTQRLQMYLKDGYVHQRILQVDQMNIEDHQRVITPSQFMSGRIKPQPKIIMTGETIELGADTPSVKLAKEVMKEWQTQGKLRKEPKSFSECTQEERREIMAEVNRLQILDLTAKAVAKENSKTNFESKGKVDTGNPFKLEEIDEEPKEENVNMKSAKESIVTTSLNDAVNTILLTAVEDSDTDGVVLPYEKLDIVHIAKDGAQLETVKNVLKTGRNTSRNLNELWSTFVANKAILPAEFVSIYDAQCTDATNYALKHVAGLTNLSIESFLEDFGDLLGLMKTKIDNGDLTEEAFNLFHRQLETDVCCLSYPKAEGINKYFDPKNKDRLLAQHDLTTYRYDNGQLVYVPMVSSSLSLGNENSYLISSDERTQLGSLFKDLDFKYRHVLATRDRKFYYIFKSDTGYFLAHIPTV